jgi:hypothetical protein
MQLNADVPHAAVNFRLKPSLLLIETCVIAEVACDAKRTKLRLIGHPGFPLQMSTGKRAFVRIERLPGLTALFPAPLAPVMGGPFYLTADLFPIGGIERSQNTHGTILSASPLQTKGFHAIVFCHVWRRD